MSGYNGFNSSNTFDSIGLEGEDIPSMVGTGAIRFNTTTRYLEISNDGAAWLQIGAGPAASVTAGTNINIATVGGNSVISTVASPNFTDVTLGSTSLASVASTVTADLDQAVKTTSTPNFAGLTTPSIDIPGVGHTHISDQQIQWPSGRLTFMQNITSAVEIGANSIYLKQVHSNGAGNLILMDNLNVGTGVLIDGRDIAVDGATLDSTVTTVGILNGYLDQAVKTTSSPSFVAVNTTGINSTSGMTNQQKYSNWIDTDPYSSTGGERLSLYSDSGAAITSGARMGILTIGGATNATHNYANGIFIEGKATQAWSTSANGSQINMYTCPNGATNPVKALTVDQDQTVGSVSSISWNNGLGKLTNSSTDPMVQSANALHVNVNSSDVAVFGTGGVTTLNALDQLNTSTGLVANNFVVGGTGKAVTGGLRMNGTALEYYNGTGWSSSGSVVTAGTNMSFSGTALGLIANPTLAGLLTCNAGLSATNSSSTTATEQLYNNATAASVPTIWSITPNLTTGQKTTMLHGVAGATNNCATLTFNYSGNGSTANSVGLGVFSNDNLLTIDGTGNAAIVGDCICGGAVKGNSSQNGVAPLVSQNNSTISGTLLSCQEFAPSLAAGSVLEHQLGVANTNNNCALLDFNYVSAGSTSNSLGLGFKGATNLFTINPTGSSTINSSVAGTHTLSLNNSGTATFVALLKMLAPNATQRAELWLGKAAAVNDCGIIDFNYTSAGSTSNSLGLGFYGANNLFTINANGDAVISHELSVANAISTNILRCASGSTLKFWGPGSGTSSDFYFQNDSVGSTGIQISPVSSTSATYIKSLAAGGTMNFQNWVAGVPTTVLTIDDNGSYANYFQVGSGKKAATGGLAMSGSALQYYDGSAWQTVQKTTGMFNTFGSQVYVVNNSGTLSVFLIGSNHNLGTGSYNIALGSGNTSIDVTIPGTITGSYVMQWSGEQGYCTPPSNIRTTISGSNNVIRMIPSYNTTGDQTWAQILPNNGDNYYFNFIVTATP